MTQFLEAQGLVNASVANAIAKSDLFPQPNTGNTTLDVFNVTQRITTDIMFRCLDQATVEASVVNNVFPVNYVYEFDRSYQVRSFLRGIPQDPILTYRIRLLDSTRTRQSVHLQSTLDSRTATLARLTSNATPASSTTSSAPKDNSACPTGTQRTSHSGNTRSTSGVPSGAPSTRTRAPAGSKRVGTPARSSSSRARVRGSRRRVGTRGL